MSICSVYNKYAANNRDLRGLRVPPQATPTPETQPKVPATTSQRFKSPGFRRAVRTVLSHWGYTMTFGNYAKWAAAGNLRTTEHWYESAQNIANSSKPQPTLVDGSSPVSGVYFETKAGKLIEMGKCLESIKELIEYNRRVK